MSSATSSEDEETDVQDIEMDVQLPPPNDNEQDHPEQPVDMDVEHAEPPAAPAVHQDVPAINRNDQDNMDTDPQTNTSGAAPTSKHRQGKKKAVTAPAEEEAPGPVEEASDRHSRQKTGRPSQRANKVYVEVPRTRPQRVKESFEGRLAPQVCPFPFLIEHMVVTAW